MGNVDLGQSAPNTQKEEKQKVIYMNISGVIGLIIKMYLIDEDQFKDYINGFISSIKESLPKEELIKLICQMYQVPNLKKFKKTRESQYLLVTKIFGKDIWK